MNNLVKYLVEGILEDESVNTTVLLPGGFKPPHGGHLDLAKKYAAQPGVIEVKILIGPEPREGITRDDSVRVWEKLTSNIPEITIQRVNENSPLAAAYKFLETAAPGTYALASSTKGEDYKRVQQFTTSHAEGGKYHKKGVKVIELPLDARPLVYADRTDNLNGAGISASTLRKDIRNRDYQNFITNYPNTEESILKPIYSILTKELMSELLTEGVVCEICGSVLKQITPNHLKHKHQMTILEYLNKYPGAATHSDNLKHTLRVNNPMKDQKNIDKIKKTKEDRFGSVKEAANVEKAKQTKLSRYGNENYNNPRFGEANSSKRPEVREKISQGVKESYTVELRDLRRQLFTERRNSTEFREHMYELGLMYRPGEREDKKYYTQKVREATQQNFTKYFHSIENAKLRGHHYHLDHKLSIDEGYRKGISISIIAHPANFQILPKAINEAKGAKSSISLSHLLRDIALYEDDANSLFGRELLLCGGAAGHLVHPYEDVELTFEDVKNMIMTTLGGEVEFAQEKLDGQNLMVTYKDGQVRAARNKGQIKNFGANSLTTKQVEDMFAGRGSIQTAFTEAMKDLETAINSLTTQQKKYFFDNGKKFLNFEVLYPATANVIPYGATQLRLHNIRTYDEAGNVVSEDSTPAKQLEGALRQIEAQSQKTYEIRVSDPAKIKKSADYKNQQKELLTTLKSIQSKYKLNQQSTIGDYIKNWWRDYIKNKAKDYSYNIPNNVVELLVNRWGFSNKETSIKDVKAQIDNGQFSNWVTDFDKSEYNKQKKVAIKEVETLFLKLGVYVLQNVENLVSLNPDEGVRSIRKELRASIEKIKQAAKTPEGEDDKASLEFLKRELTRIKDIGGFKAIVPTEGIVFKHNGKLYKLTGLFAPINQIIGYMRF